MAEKECKLICIPYAGGGARDFDVLAGSIAANISVVSLEYAGHGSRVRESFYADFQEMVVDIAETVQKHIQNTDTYAILGYSMGSIVAYELVAQGLLGEQPSHLFLAAHEAPNEEWESRQYAKLDDLQFAEKIVGFGGFERFEEKFLRNKYFRKMIFDPIRADYGLLAGYQWAYWDRVCIPATLFYAPHDIETKKVKKWNDYFCSPVELIELGTNHFFIREQTGALAKKIEERLLGVSGEYI